MKIGFSLGRCVRDIVNGEVSLDDVAFIIAATAIRDREKLKPVIQDYMFREGYLYGLDEEQCLDASYNLWDSNKILQPRLQGIHRHMQPEDSIWVDIFPTTTSNNESVKRAWDAYRFMIHMTENVDNESLEVFK
jgi:hypothetical protein